MSVEILQGRVDGKEEAKKLHEDMVARATTVIAQGYHLMIFASILWYNEYRTSYSVQSFVM